MKLVQLMQPFKTSMDLRANLRLGPVMPITSASPPFRPRDCIIVVIAWGASSGPICSRSTGRTRISRIEILRMFSHRKIQMQMFVQIRNFHNLQMICTAGYQEQEQPPLCRLRDERFIRLNSKGFWFSSLKKKTLKTERTIKAISYVHVFFPCHITISSYKSSILGLWGRISSTKLSVPAQHRLTGFRCISPLRSCG